MCITCTDLYSRYDKWVNRNEWNSTWNKSVLTSDVQTWIVTLGFLQRKCWQLMSAVISPKMGDQDSSVEPPSGGANFSPLLKRTKWPPQTQTSDARRVILALHLTMHYFARPSPSSPWIQQRCHVLPTIMELFSIQLHWNIFLFLKSDRNKNNPEWAVDWVAQDIYHKNELVYAFFFSYTDQFTSILYKPSF